MRIPQTPPDLELLRREINRDGRMEEVYKLAAKLGAEGTAEYLHWDELRRREPPEGYSLKELWFALKFIRKLSVRAIPLLDQEGIPFFYFLTNKTQEKLHEFDKKTGGVFEVSAPLADPQAKNRYIVSTLIEEAITSSQLEGAVATRQIAEDMIRARRRPRDRSERMILNNYRTMEYIAELKNESMTPELLLEIHRKVTEGTLENPAAVGRLRTPEDKINIVDVENNVLHTPPRAGELQERMRRLCSFANRRIPPKEFIHPIIRAIMLHFWLAYDHPFVDGNGRTARALFYWAMLNYGYWLFEFVSISGRITQAPAKYARSFLYTETDENDLNYFIRHQVTIIAEAIDRLRAYIDRKREETAGLGAILRTVNLNHRQINLLSHAIRHPRHQYTMKSHQESNRVAYATAHTDLLALEKIGLLRSFKRGREMVFEPCANLSERLRELSE